MWLSVQVWGVDVIQGIVLERGWGWMNLERNRVGRAMSRGGANRADSLGWRLQRCWGSLMETIFFGSN